MAISDLYSKRQKRLRGEMPDVYVYDEIPRPLRVQIVHIVTDAIGSDKSQYTSNAETAYRTIHDRLSREYGLFALPKKTNETVPNALLSFFLEERNTERCLDFIELTFKYISTIIRGNIGGYLRDTTVKCSPKDAIYELNERFKEHAVGYQFENDEIIRLDSTYIHSEVVKPALSLLSNPKFTGASEEYLKAHEHYRHGRNKECLTECLKAFESTLKIICHEKGWVYNQNDTAKKLIQVCFQNGLVPSFTQNQFTSLQNLLESGIPTIRNKLGGHGQGQVPQKVDDEMTRYGLNLTGTNIIFLIEQSGLQ